MSDRPKRRRLNGDISGRDDAETPKAFPNGTLASATAADKSRWKGFCEIESEPAFFSVMLRDFGVKGVKVQEIFSLDDEMLADLPRPIHGLIFLYQWREDDPEKQEATCPEGVWFANQTVNHACATVALLNIVNNIEGADLGDHLRHFKDFTGSFTPALRGDAIGNFEYVRNIHNSFARKMEMLNVDLQLKNDATSKKRKNRRGSSPDDDSESAFHFIAFVPVAEQVWKLDGLERQPVSLGNIGNQEWLDLAKPFIVSKMADYQEGQIQFSILGVVEDPAVRLRSELAYSVKTARETERVLESRGIPSAAANSGESNCLGEIGLSEQDVAAADVQMEVLQDLEDTPACDLQVRLSKQATMQAELRSMLLAEQQAQRNDEERAARRRHDYGPAIHAWVNALARKNMIEPLI